MEFGGVPAQVPSRFPSTGVPFRARLLVAMGEGVRLGVKWMIVLVLGLWALSWALADYAAVRQAARQGQAAAQYLERLQAAQRAAPAAPASGQPPGALR